MCSVAALPRVAAKGVSRCMWWWLRLWGGAWVFGVEFVGGSYREISLRQARQRPSPNAHPTRNSPRSESSPQSRSIAERDASYADHGAPPVCSIIFWWV